MTVRRGLVLLILLGIGGIILFVNLFVRHGISDIMQVTLAAGWGLALVMLVHFIPMAVDVLDWSVLIPRKERLAFPRLLWIRWIGDSVSSMLPVAQVGGEVVRVRLAAMYHMRTSMAAASVIVDMTLSVLTQLIFTLSGLFLLTVFSGKGFDWKTISVGIAISIVCIGGFIVVQHIGMFRIIGAIAGYVMRSKEWNGLADKGAAFDVEVRDIYKHRSRIFWGCFWTMVCWGAQALEVYVAMKVLGIHGNYGHAYVLESASQGIRSALFLVPGAIGVQEGGYVLIGGMLGIPADAALALALVRRARELLFGIPGILAWQWVDGRGIWRNRHRTAAMPPPQPALQASQP